ncbi:RagB/SusD family nutrient uptake outer membrane protein [Mariniflexile sp. AS56]|uniref:RagB/SusD family nutrient uptake outer membrane protein n=1 Tax=Mariniflexile sp. AS56 TaxID=3063957 RepID=UPI0026EDFD74|nr:RagB/SusD family nutrient uptake outer membrane protein [Mariniflexile sp. AS56]MDO7173170.1 RagB/SusD family nutrient uptake outer membrane protein [Mariniflexile sp. AS56]
MKKYLILTTVLFVMFGTLLSCDDYLEETNPNQISSDIYWSTLDESNANLTSVYNGMLNEFLINARVEAWRSDEGYAGQRISNSGIPNIDAGALNWYNQQIDENTLEVGKRWDALYNVIFRANQVIQGLNGMTDDLKSQEKWTEQMGQARFFRGLAHFYLHSTYNQGRIIIREKNPVAASDFPKAVSESDDVIKFFRTDLEYAYTNLPGQLEPKTRVDAGTAGTILGMSYLYENDFQTAKTYFNDIINNVNKDYGYQLEQDASIMFTRAGDYNSESIFEINYSLLIPQNTNFFEYDYLTRSARYSAPGSAGGSSTLEAFTPATWLVHAYSTDELDETDPRNTVTNHVGVKRLRKVSLRASAMVAVVNDEDTPYYGAISAPILHNFRNLGLFGYFKKYTNHDITNNEGNLGTNSWQSPKNVIVNRLSGVYLMMAECLNETGDAEGALFHINKVRDRWALKDLSSTDYDSKEKIRERLQFYEYPMELSVEGFSTRNIDLRRWGIAKQRYTDLSEAEYYATDYDYTDEEGNQATRPDCLVRAGVSPNPSEDIQIVPEFSITAQNYKDGYLPIPVSEVINNPLVSN